ncbi:MAG TPA: sigma-54 dependent transcriptional regulator [Saprospiraceae bacterium]|nr:sigma-54 dependent transcriptional regulator [Saprospiraceae bacterium]
MNDLQAIKRRFGIIGRSKVLDQALATAVRVAKTDLTVLITGESGVGKEAFSKIIHQLSARKHNPFIAINCGAIPEGTINSELFGHEKGAFTGATSDRKGYFETVNGGTIFLDEIGEMPLDTQSFLLRVLESGEFIRVGSSAIQTTDVRVIAATNVNLMDKINQGKFREDLYYRLNTVPIFVPALRKRKEDIYMLFRKFVLDFADKYKSQPIELDEEARKLLEQYQWKGNIRELKNVAEQLSVLSQKPLITSEDLSRIINYSHGDFLPSKIEPSVGGGDNLNFKEREIFYKLLFEMKNDINELKSFVYGLARNNDLEIPVSKEDNLLPTRLDMSELPDNRRKEIIQTTDAFDVSPTSGTYDNPYFDDEEEAFSESEVIEENLSIEDMEKELIRKALKKYRGKRKEAAQELGISERTLYRKIKQYDLN